MRACIELVCEPRAVLRYKFVHFSYSPPHTHTHRLFYYIWILCIWYEYIRHGMCSTVPNVFFFFFRIYTLSCATRALLCVWWCASAQTYFILYTTCAIYWFLLLYFFFVDFASIYTIHFMSSQIEILFFLLHAARNVTSSSLKTRVARKEEEASVRMQSQTDADLFFLWRSWTNTTRTTTTKMEKKHELIIKYGNDQLVRGAVAQKNARREEEKNTNFLVN